MSRKTVRRISKPSFLWQGILIVLPATLLGGFGLFSLRQDRLLARHEAAELAGEAAQQLVEVSLPDAFRVALPSVGDWQARAWSQRMADEDPVQEIVVGGGPVVACLMDEQGGLLYPRPTAPYPTPVRLDVTELSEDMKVEWSRARARIFTGGDWGQAVAAFESFLSMDPPAVYAALAEYHLALALAGAGRISDAQTRLERIREKYPDALTESGVPLAPMAALSWLRLQPDGSPEKQSALQSLCARAVQEPTLLSPLLLRRAREVEGLGASATPSKLTSERWLNLWALHEAARAFSDEVRRVLGGSDRTARNVGSSFWLLMPGSEPLLVFPQGDGNHWWWLAWPKGAVRQAVQQTIRMLRLPEYLDVSVSVAGESIRAPEAEGVALASRIGRLSGSSPAGEIEAEAHLIGPEKLYARQRARTVWFGSLIGLSTGAVLIGFLAAYRAFRNQQQLNELKSNFVSSVSHELRAPIASVRLMAEELNEVGLHDRQKSKEYHRFIVQECRRLSALIENVLDFSRHEQGRKEYEFEPADLAALVRQTVKLMQPYAAEREVGLAAQFTPPPGVQGAEADEAFQAEVDGRSIQQALINLIDNAIKHSPQGSTVEVGVDFASSLAPDARTAACVPRATLHAPRSTAPSPQRAHHSTQVSGTIDERLLLWVEDQGEGIPPEDHERIFERFYRRGSELRRETPGIGLGLAIVKFVVEAHGGQVQVRSAPGQGSRFTLQLPVRRGNG